VALPTYSYVACFSATGTYLGVRAEMTDLPQGTAQTRPLAADPEQAIVFLRRLGERRHELVEGVDWFRLPFPGDRQNWTAAAWREVVAGRPLARSCRLECRVTGPLIDLAVSNETGQPLPLPGVRLNWKGAGAAADVAAGWSAAVTGGEATFHPRPVAGFLAPGERRVVGWARLSEARPVEARLLDE
jgi:hypothetical protein